MAVSKRSAAASASAEGVSQVRLVSPTPEAFKEAIESIPIDFGCVAPRLTPDGGVVGNVLVTPSSLALLREKSDLVRVEVLRDPSDGTFPAVGKGNRFADPRTLPKGLGVLVHEEPR
jgi:hypothetical protein